MVALLTSKGTEFVTEPSFAVIITLPGFSPDTWLTDTIWATNGSDEDQSTIVLRVLVLPLLKCPIAVATVFVPCAILLASWISIELRLLASTVSALLSFTPSKTAEMLVVPRFFAVTTPLTVTVATVVDDELQVDTLVTSCVVLSEKVAVTVNC